MTNSDLNITTIDCTRDDVMLAGDVIREVRQGFA